MAHVIIGAKCFECGQEITSSQYETASITGYHFYQKRVMIPTAGGHGMCWKGPGFLHTHCRAVIDTAIRLGTAGLRAKVEEAAASAAAAAVANLKHKDGKKYIKDKRKSNMNRASFVHFLSRYKELLTQYGIQVDPDHPDYDLTTGYHLDDIRGFHENYGAIDPMHYSLFWEALRTTHEFRERFPKLRSKNPMEWHTELMHIRMMHGREGLSGRILSMEKEMAHYASPAVPPAPPVVTMTGKRKRMAEPEVIQPRKVREVADGKGVGVVGTFDYDEEDDSEEEFDYTDGDDDEEYVSDDESEAGAGAGAGARAVEKARKQPLPDDGDI